MLFRQKRSKKPICPAIPGVTAQNRAILNRGWDFHEPLSISFVLPPRRGGGHKSSWEIKYARFPAPAPARGRAVFGRGVNREINYGRNKR